MIDAVIVGAGPVGLTAAITLGERGYRVLLIEKSKAFEIKDDISSRTIALSYASMRIFESLSLWQKLEKGAVPIHHVKVSMKGKFGTSRLSTQPSYDALGYVVGCSDLEKILLEKANLCKHIEILNPATLIKRQAHIENWELTIEGKSSPVFCKLLIAADGVHSPLRDEQRIPTQIKDYHHYALLTNLHLPQLPTNTAIERFLPQGAIALLPWRNQLATCVWTTSQEEANSLKNLPQKEFMRRCEATLGKRLGKISALGERLAFPLTMTLAMSQTGPRFLLLGNAAHNLHPIAAQGLNLSLRDVWQLRSQLVKTKERSDLGSQSFLQEYALMRKKDQERVIFVTDKIAKYMSSSLLPSEIRAMGITLFDCITPIKQQFMRMAMGLPSW